MSTPRALGTREQHVRESKETTGGEQGQARTICQVSGVLVCLAGCSARLQRPACFVSRQLIADSDALWIPWLRKDKARGKTHATTAFTLLFTIIAGGCHWLMAPGALRISSARPGQKKPMEKQKRCRQWIIAGGGSFPQSPQMQECEYFIRCIHKKESPVPYFCHRRERRGDFVNPTQNDFGCTNWSSAASVANAGLIYLRQINPHYKSHHPLYISILILFKMFISYNDLSPGKKNKILWEYIFQPCLFFPSETIGLIPSTFTACSL